MAVFDGDAVKGHDRIQIVTGHLRIQRARQTHGTQVRAAPLRAVARELAADEAVIESYVVGDEQPAREARAQLRGDAVEGRRIRQHAIVDPGESSDARRYVYAG